MMKKKIEQVLSGYVRYTCLGDRFNVQIECLLDNDVCIKPPSYFRSFLMEETHEKNKVAVQSIKISDKSYDRQILEKMLPSAPYTEVFGPTGNNLREKRLIALIGQSQEEERWLQVLFRYMRLLNSKELTIIVLNCILGIPVWMIKKRVEGMGSAYRIKNMAFDKLALYIPESFLALMFDEI